MNDFSKRTFIFYFVFGKNKVKNCNILNTKSPIKRSNISISKDSSLSIGEKVLIRNSNINIDNGTLIISDNCSIMNANITVNNGTIIIGEYCRIMCNLWVRFGGKISIGKYTNINNSSELRSDESIIIGDFTQISYNVSIWDTNTHYIYPSFKRRQLSKKIGIGNEIEKPLTKPIVIGSDCWIGKDCAIMKGSHIGNNVILGYNTTIINKTIEDNMIVVPKIELKYKQNSNI